MNETYLTRLGLNMYKEEILSDSIKYEKDFNIILEAIRTLDKNEVQQDVLEEIEKMYQRHLDWKAEAMEEIDEKFVILQQAQEIIDEMRNYVCED